MQVGEGEGQAASAWAQSPCGASSHDPEILIQAKIKSQMLNDCSKTDFNTSTDHLGILLWCRFWILCFSLVPRWGLGCWPEDSIWNNTRIHDLLPSKWGWRVIQIPGAAWSSFHSRLCEDEARALCHRTFLIPIEVLQGKAALYQSRDPWNASEQMSLCSLT